MTCFFLGIEKSVIRKTKYSLSLTTLLGVLIGLLALFDFLDRDITMMITYIISTLSTVIIIALFAWMVSKSTGSIRRKSIITFLGVVVLFAGIMMDSELVYGTLWQTMPLIIPPILNSIGLITITITNMR